MRTRPFLLVVGVAIAGVIAAGTPAAAQPIDKGHFHDVFTDDPYSCDGLPAQDSGDIFGNYLLNQRGSSPFPYYRESVHGTFLTTNLLTGGTFTQVFASSNQDHVITDNDDGTITILVHGTGGFRAYDQFGKLVLKDPGNIRFSFVIDYGGTPGDPSDDTEIAGSFQVVRDSTGLNDTEGRDFCEDVALFTS